MKPSIVLPVLLAFVLAGCTSVHTRRFAHADLTHYHRFFVEHRLNDDRHLDDAIVAELQALGREASAGPLTMMPDNTEVIVTYHDQWAWDFRNYLIQLNIEFRDALRDRPLAYGSYRQPTVFTKSTPGVVRAILLPLFRKS